MVDNPPEQVEVEIDELVSYRAENPTGEDVGFSRDQEDNSDEGDQSMEFNDNTARREDQLPFDCTQFYLQQ